MSLVILIGAEGGGGKTIQSQRFPEPVAYIDFEYPKGQKCLSLHNSSKLISLYPCREIWGYSLEDNTFVPSKIIGDHKKGQINIKATSSLIKTTIDTVISKSSDYETIVLDSISDIRDIIAMQWLEDYKAKGAKQSERKTIGKDPSAWSQINKIVCDDILFPIINIGRIEDKNIIFTSRLTDEYRLVDTEQGKQESVKTGNRILDVQSWVSFEIDAILELSTNAKGKYYLYGKKSPIGVIPKVEITDKTVYDYLLQIGAI